MASTNCIAPVRLLSVEAIAGTETPHRCKHLDLQAPAALCVRLLLAETYQELPDKGAD
ncbi:MAG: hypothetical protein HY744_28595 [Deltaproteobacteria bacterium]|nr:hypothetical protein [Deltaproteobacteria bacterium]